jgi:hypothetical protein
MRLQMRFPTSTFSPWSCRYRPPEFGKWSRTPAKGWFANSNDQLQEISAGGLKIDIQVSQLVQVMATYSANNPGFDPTASGASTVPNDTSLQTAVSAAWHI